LYLTQNMFQSICMILSNLITYKLVKCNVSRKKKVTKNDAKLQKKTKNTHTHTHTHKKEKGSGSRGA